MLRRGALDVILSHDSSGQDMFCGSVPTELGTGWHVLTLGARRQKQEWLAILAFYREGKLTEELPLLLSSLSDRSGLKRGIAHLSGPPDRVTVRLHGMRLLPDSVRLRLRPTSPKQAAVGVLLQQPRRVLGRIRTASGPLRERLREALAETAVNGQRTPVEYGSWLQFFDHWSADRLSGIVAALPARLAVQAVVCHAGQPGAALDATLASLRDLAYPVSRVDVVGPGGALPPRTAPFTAVLQAGEVLASHALPLLLHALSGPDAADAAYADEDRLALDGRRFDPSFKPQPGLMMMCSGLLSRGVWLLRSDLLADQPAPDCIQHWAESLRLQVWFDLYAAGRGGRVRRVPALLTHRRHDAEASPPAILSGVVDAGLQRLGVEATAEPGFPIRLHWDAAGTRTVSLVVPSRLRSAVTIACMLDVVTRTAYPHLSMIVVVTQDAPLDAMQAEAAGRLEATGRARVVVLRRGSFNFSAACNHGAALTSGELICLLNDDVSLIGGDWLGQMAAMFSDPQTGIVGAKLYYPDGRTQHGGVLLGIAGLADHAHRWLKRGEPGYMARAILDQEMSAVTGACLVIRRSLFDQVAGLDEGLPNAFNDVDLCLRIRALGYSVIMAASVELVHHETLTFGHHYGHDAAAELADVRLMQRRWPEVIGADPYHNPNLSLVPGCEWETAMPPRGDPALTGDRFRPGKARST